MIDKEEVKSWVLMELVHFSPKGKVQITDRMSADLQLDSIELVEFLILAEEKYNITIDESTVDDDITVEGVADLIYSLATEG